MHTQVSTERSYSIGFFKAAGKGGYGISISVAGDKKKKGLAEAKELLEQAQLAASEVYTRIGKAGDNESA